LFYEQFFSLLQCCLLQQNALRAVVEYHSAGSVLPNLKVLICRGRKDVAIKVCIFTVLLAVIPFEYMTYFATINNFQMKIG